jgi:hypothetical protein
MARRSMGLTFTVRSTLSSFWRGFRDAFSNIHVDIHDTIEQDAKVVARWTMAMTHTGAFLGIAPANKRVTVNGISIQRFVNRQISAGRDNCDQLGAGSARSRTGAQVSVRCLSYIRRFLVRIKYATARYFSSYHHAVLS